MKTVLSIAGSDCSGGAGIQADLKTMAALGVYGMSAVTALTAQNTTGVYGIEETSPDFLGQQLDCIFTDIFPDAVKIGMVSSVRLIEVIVKKLTYYGAKQIVVDPVMVSTSNSKLIEDEAVLCLKETLLPLATVVTPNLPEAEVLSRMDIHDNLQTEEAARRISAGRENGVLLKGGHHRDHANDLLFYQGEMTWFSGAHIDNPNTHGTGCTLSTAIACGLASGLGVGESVRAAKDYITGALEAGLDLGKGSGPLNHCYANGQKNLLFL